MSIFSAIGGVISAVVSGVCSCVSSLCSKIGIGGLGDAVSSFIQKIVVVMNDPLDIGKIIETIAEVIGKIAEMLGIKDEEEQPEELAMKAELDETDVEKYESTQEYIEHLRNDIKLRKEDEEKLENMSDEEKAAYCATGVYLYTKATNEKLGFDNTGLKNPELIGITGRILVDLAKVKEILRPSDFIVYNNHLQSQNLDIKDLSNYLHNQSKDGKVDAKVQSALTSAFKEISPEIKDKEIEQKLVDLQLEE